MTQIAKYIKDCFTLGESNQCFGSISFGETAQVMAHISETKLKGDIGHAPAHPRAVRSA
jgi:hypothetical protein